VQASVTVRRVSDQDSEFLRFVERHDLKPGEVVRVEERDTAADSVRLRGRDQREFTIGARAASKVLVQAVRAMVAFLLLSSAALAQTPNGAPASEPFQIMDNSFLVEEAFNQPGGVFQNIFGAQRLGDAWALGFTQEWPVRSERHQLSYSLALVDTGSDAGLGDTLIHYRYQVSMDALGRVAFSPRVTLILPSGDSDRGLGNGSAGLQFNLPVSKQAGNWQWNGNGGMTWLRGVPIEDGGSEGRREGISAPFLAGSAIYRVRSMFYLMMESVLVFDEVATRAGTVRETSITASPGVRGGWNFGEHQVVLGLAVPITWSDGRDTGAFAYLSYELPFGR
jgi:hypothetical protein